MTLKGMEVCFKYIMLGIHPIHQKMSNIGRPDVYYDKQITDIFIYIYILYVNAPTILDTGALLGSQNWKFSVIWPLLSIP